MVMGKGASGETTSSAHTGIVSYIYFKELSREEPTLHSFEFDEANLETTSIYVYRGACKITGVLYNYSCRLGAYESLFFFLFWLTRLLI